MTETLGWCYACDQRTYLRNGRCFECACETEAPTDRYIPASWTYAPGAPTIADDEPTDYAEAGELVWQYYLGNIPTDSEVYS